MEGSRAKNDHHMGLIYGDYYFIEALQRYQEAVGTAGDFDGDGDVDVGDLLNWQRNDGTSAGLAAWQSAFNGSQKGNAESVASIPEPATASAFALAIMLALRHRLR